MASSAKRTKKRTDRELGRSQPSLENLEQRLLLSVNLPGLQLVDQAADRFDGQVVYLDFDGAQNVTYRGPVEISGIDVPAFKAPGGIAGQEEAIIGQLTRELNSLFAQAGITFVTELPPDDGVYSTIFIGGDDSRFAGYGSFLGVAEQVDIGNQNPSDNAFVFSNILGEPSGGLEQYAADLGAAIAHETGRLLGYADSNPREDTGLLASLASTYYSAYGQNRSTNWTVTAGSHNFQVDGIATAKNTEWYVNGSYTGTAQNDWSGWVLAIDPEYTRSFSAGTTTEIKALIYDNNWNYQQYHIWNVTVPAPDTTGPTTPGTPDMASGSDSGQSSSDNVTNDNTPTFSWSASSDSGSGVAGYEYKLGSGSWNSIGNTTSYTLSSLSDGSYTIYVRAKDNAGNYGSSSSGASFQIDRTAPGLPSLSSPSNGATVSTLQPTVSWSAPSDASGIWKYHLKVIENWGVYWDKVDK
ncbi:MAG: Ig-like domain-containing protein, partial [Phycisphaerae bacterium]